MVGTQPCDNVGVSETQNHPHTVVWWQRIACPFVEPKNTLIRMLSMLMLGDAHLLNSSLQKSMRSFDSPIPNGQMGVMIESSRNK